MGRTSGTGGCTCNATCKGVRLSARPLGMLTTIGMWRLTVNEILLS